jgi:hypothetical protein
MHVGVGRFRKHETMLVVEERLPRRIRVYGLLHRLRPADPRWSRRIGRYYLSRARRGGPPELTRQLAESSLVWLGNCVDLTDARNQANGARRQPLGHFLERAEMAIAAERYDDAQRFATALMSQGEEWSDAHDLHQAYAILGLVSFRHGDLAEASSYLRRSADVDAGSSPALKSFGPSDASIQLADKVLGAGDRDSVVGFLTTVVERWRSPGLTRTLNSWIEQIGQGATFSLRSVELAAPRATRWLDQRDQTS